MTAPAVDIDAHVAGRVRAALTVAAGERVALVGPNGSGKSTLVELVAGLVRPSAGRVGMGGRTVADDATWVPPHERHVGLLGQEPLLFDHLSVVDNVAFGLRSRGVARRTHRQTAQGLRAGHAVRRPERETLARTGDDRRRRCGRGRGGRGR